MERAELICDRSGELAALVGPYDVGDVAIDLLRAADHDETTLTHALSIGRSRMRGVKPRAEEFASSGVQR